MTARNAWEAEARARKCAALCRAIDRDLTISVELATGVRVDAATTARFLRSRDDAWWKAVSREHGIRPPSALTIEAVCLEYEARAEEDLEGIASW